MVDFQGSEEPPFFFKRDLCLHDIDRQSLYAYVLGSILMELDDIRSLLSEGNTLLETIDGELNCKEITAIIHYLNNHLSQHTIRMSALRYKIQNAK